MNIAEFIIKEKKLLKEFNNNYNDINSILKTNSKLYNNQYLIKYFNQTNYRVVSNAPNGNSIVFSNGHDVIKIFQNDPAYLEYIKLCLNNQSNIHFPKVASNSLMNLLNNTILIKTELLYPISENVYNNSGLYDLINYYMDQMDYGIELSNPSEKSNTKAYSFINKYPQFLDAFNLINDNLIKKGFKWDLHHENFMMRNNVVVISDPVLS